MKAPLIAAAALLMASSATYAQTNLTIYGIVDSGLVFILRTPGSVTTTAQCSRSAMQPIRAAETRHLTSAFDMRFKSSRVKAAGSPERLRAQSPLLLK
jgi:hypothetical protein